MSYSHLTVLQDIKIYSAYVKVVGTHSESLSIMLFLSLASSHHCLNISYTDFKRYFQFFDSVMQYTYYRHSVYFSIFTQLCKTKLNGNLKRLKYIKHE